MPESDNKYNLYLMSKLTSKAVAIKGKNMDVRTAVLLQEKIRFSYESADYFLYICRVDGDLDRELLKDLKEY